MDNAAYHNKLLNSAPTSNSKKSDMIAWLKAKGIEFDSSMLTPSLYELVCQHKDQSREYSIDKMLSDAGHATLRLPPYHPDLNPMELAWASIKAHVAKQTTPMVVERLIELVEEKLALMSETEWAELCEKVKQVENEYIDSDSIIDQLTETYTICDSDAGSDSESQSESEAADTNSDSDSSMDIVVDSSDNSDVEVMRPAEDVV
ncbi:uncharacterized protein LOC142982355 [Anticarsia gemmatalis]|uniref:uncharacterized protein LOC142982355 n=1 Tax=Anticarsia gemmatalis TaxID=129554 RepID=UPI003F7706CC